MDKNFEELREGCIVSDWSTVAKGAPLVPSRSKEMVEIAEALTKAIATPFMRVDMYNGANGPIIGELTPTPGDAYYKNNYTYSDEFNAHLGASWARALERMSEDGINFEEPAS